MAKRKLLKRCKYCKNSGILLSRPEIALDYGFWGYGQGIVFKKCRDCKHGKKVKVSQLRQIDDAIQVYAKSLAKSLTTSCE